MKKLCTALLLILVFTLVLSACNPVDPGDDGGRIDAESIVLNINELSLDVGESAMLSATVYPDNADDKRVFWETSNPSVATVDRGYVSGVSAGTAVITAKTINEISAICFITVLDGVVDVSEIALSVEEISCFVGDVQSVVATITPQNATNKFITWSSSNNEVAQVVGGEITAISTGVAEITATSHNGKIATCIVTVSQKIVEVETVVFDKAEYECVVGDSFYLCATVTPDNATDSMLTWMSSDEDVLIVSSGTVVTLSPGNAIVMAMTSNGKYAHCYVTVVEKSESEPKPTPDPEPEVTPTPDPEPDPQPNPEPEPTPDPEPEPTPDPEPTPEPSPEPNPEPNPEPSPEPEKIKVESVEIDVRSVECYIGEKFTLTATIFPKNATDKTVRWVSSNDAVVQLNDGVFYAEGAGECVVFVETADGNFRAECVVKVLDLKVFSPVFEDFVFVYDGEEKFLTVENLPEDTQIIYTGNGVKDVGEYIVCAEIKKIGYVDTTISAKLTILPATYAIEYVLRVECENENPSYYETFKEMELKDPISPLYDFEGWYEDEKYEKRIEKISEGSLGNKIFYAKWSMRFIVEDGVLVGISENLRNNFERIIIPSEIDGEKIVEIGSFAFDSNKLKSVVIPSSVEIIGDEAFADCTQLTIVEFEPNSNLYEIGVFAFGNCISLRDIVLPDGLKNIGGYAFEDCDSIKELVIPKSVVKVGSDIFRNCDQGIELNVYLSFSKLPSGWSKDWCKNSDIKIHYNN